MKEEKILDVKINFPPSRELRNLWREKAQRGNKNLVDAVKRCDGRSSNPGRPRKWKEGEQVRLMTRVRPNTLLWLKSQSKDANESIGQIIDRLVELKG
jgi:hypothetical protein